MVEMYSTLFPRMKQSPYFALSWPFTYLGQRERDTREDPEVSAVACAGARGSGRAPPHLLGLLHRDVHVTVEAGEHAAVVDA